MAELGTLFTDFFQTFWDVLVKELLGWLTGLWF